MIKEIETLRRKGMSFRKIAETLNSTVGKVHYQWIKNANKSSTIINKVPEEKQMKLDSKKQLQKGHFLIATLTNDQKLASYWEIAKWQKEMVNSYFNEEINQTVILFRIYDVTDLYFTGSNAHSYFEFQLTVDKTYWVVKGIKQDRTYLTEIGYRTKHNQFFPVLRSNTVYSGKRIEAIDNAFKPERGFQENLRDNKPNWVENVSTYSYYENVK